MNLIDFINDLKKSKYWSMLLNRHNVIMVHLIGSQLTKVLDDQSDIDLLFLCTDCSMQKWENFYSFDYKGVPVHICWHNINSYIYHDNLQLNLNKISGLTCSFIDNIPEHIIYLRDGYDNGLNYLLSVKNEVSSVASNIVLYCGKKLMDSILKEGLLPDYQNKWLHHLVMCYNIAHHEELDKTYLLNLKRITEQELSNEVKNKFIIHLEQIRNYVDSLDIELLQLEAQKLNYQIQQNFQLRR